MAYDAEANVVRVTDPGGRAWSYGYDAQGNRTKATDPLGHATAYAYDTKRNVTRMTLPSGRVSSYDYDARSNLTSIKRTLTETGQTPTATFAYDGLGQLVSATDPLDRSWRYEYNAQGDQTSATSPAGRKTTASFDVQSWLVSTVSARGNALGADPAAYQTTYTRDVFGRATAVRDPLGHSATMAYDAVGNLTDATDRDGRHSQVAYDLADRATQVTRGDGSVLKTAYDALGLVTSQTDGLGRATSYAYNPLGWLTATTDPLGRKTTYGYDKAGRRTSLTDPGGRATWFGYDAASRLTSVRYSSGAPKDIAYDYDVDGRLTAMSDGTGRSSFGYDSLGRLTSSTNARGQTLGYGYDLGDQLTSLDYPDALTALDKSTGAGLDPVATGTVRRGYDADGLLTSVADWLGHTTSFDYDADGNLARIARPNATVTTLASDANGQVTELADIGLGTLLRASTPRTDEGLLASTSELGLTGAPAERFRYDGAQRLTAAGSDATRAYAYDAADNPTGLPGGVAQSFDAANELTAVTAADGSQTTLAYNSSGSRTSTTPASGAKTSYGYDQAEQLTAYAGPDRARPGHSASAQYSYDATGLRQARTVNDIERTQTYDRSGALPLLIEDGPSAYISGPDGRPIEQVLQDGTVRYFHHDARGSVRALTNQSGEVVAKYAYDAYGNRTSPATSVENPFGYDGQYTDPESGLQYLRARYYDPSTAQFLTRDPIADHTRAPYTYANNSPTNYHDPSGLWAPPLVGPTLAPDPQAQSEALAGAADGATFGLISKALGAIGIHVNRCSPSYQAGGWLPIPIPTGLINKATKVLKATKALRGVGGLPRSGAALKTDAQHAFPDIVDNYADDAARFSIPTKGPGGEVVRQSQLRQLEGGLRGKQGVFEWIIDEGRVTHRRFIPGGRVTGYPNQTP